MINTTRRWHTNGRSHTLMATESACTRFTIDFFSMMLSKWVCSLLPSGVVIVRLLGTWSHICTIYEQCTSNDELFTYHLSQVARCNRNISPHLATLLIPTPPYQHLSGFAGIDYVPLVCRRRPERNDQTQNRTEHCQKLVADIQRVVGHFCDQRHHCSGH
jgi:hypothetical protein